MDKMEILQCIANSHNRLTQIMVNGDSAILMGETLKELRLLVQTLQKDVEAEQNEDENEKSAE